jgi:hypothetical protein
MNTRRLVFCWLAAIAPLSAQITGAPYSATQTSEHIQTLADGTHITQPGRKGMVYRDSAGRMRNEVTTTGFQTSDQRETVVTIIDPVAGFRYQLNSRDKVAQRFAMPARRPAGTTSAAPPATGRCCDPVPISGPSGNTTSESLGTQVLEGVTVVGTRRTTTFAVGSMGNDREIVVTLEIWYSQQLQVQVVTKMSDPRLGDGTTKLTDISPAEPDPALFMPPADYTIKDMAASTINR